MILRRVTKSTHTGDNKLFHKLSNTAFLLTLLLFTTQVAAKVITPSAALDIAKRYVHVDKQVQRNVKMRATQAPSTLPYYIYNDAQGKGFVIVSGNDAMGEVLGYSHNGTLDTTSLNPEARFLLQNYRQAYEELQQAPAAKMRAFAPRSASDEVRPLLKTRWGQREPFNKKTGYVTGCVATAMAQLMYFHQWPKRGRGQNSYTLSTDQSVRSADFSQSEYKWSQMLPDYSSGAYTPVQADAVALLMNDAGISVYMQYTHAASSASNYSAAKALRDNFDYDVATISKIDEGTSHFLEIIQSELRKGFPLYISGFTKYSTSGHAWIVDGFDREGLVHMNFGWSGQADGYYSLYALSLTTSGQEFNGRPLSFNRQLMVIAAHPNKAGVEPIDEQLRSSAPNIAFGIDGDMHFVGDAPTNISTEGHIVYKNFTNQSAKSFRGDFGVGIYSAEGSLVRACPSAYHTAGGYTVSRYADYNGEMSPSGLIVEDVEFKLDFTGLTNGTYTLLPIAAARDESGQFGTWTKIKKAPRMVIEVKDGNIIYHEMPSTAPAFQLFATPTFEKPLYSGGTNKARLALRKLNGLPFDGKVKLEFIDSNGTVAASFTTENVVDFEEFATTKVKLPLQLPYDMASADYSLRITIIKKDTNEECVVRNYNMGEATVVKVLEQEESTAVLANVLGFVSDNSGASMPSENIDMRYNNVFKIGCIVYKKENVDYNGPSILQLIDTEDGRKITLNTFPSVIRLNSSNESVQIISGWLRASSLKIINNRRYQVALMGNVEGKDVNLWPETASPLYVSIINGPYNTYPDDVTNGIHHTSETALISFDDGLLELRQAGLQQVSVYNLSGVLVAKKWAQGQNYLSFSLPRAAYIVKITTHNGSYTKVVK